MADRFGLGLPQDQNRLAASNPDWPLAFEAEAARLKASLGPFVIAIEHYGSTSVPGLAAKPILDLLVGVAGLADVPAWASVMAGLGYEDRGREVVPGHHIFGRGEARPIWPISCGMGAKTGGRPSSSATACGRTRRSAPPTRR